jgi:hypothetical protein
MSLLPALFIFTLEYGITRTHERQVGLILSGTYSILAYVDDVNLPGDNIRTVKKKKHRNFKKSARRLV